MLRQAVKSPELTVGTSCHWDKVKITHSAPNLPFCVVIIDLFILLAVHLYNVFFEFMQATARRLSSLVSGFSLR